MIDSLVDLTLKFSEVSTLIRDINLLKFKYLNMSKDDRVSSLLTKLSSTLPEIRSRSLQNLAFKVSAGLVLPERVVSNVAATRSLISLLEKSSPELTDVLHILALIATKDAWSAAVLVDAGALDAAQA